MENSSDHHNNQHCNSSTPVVEKEQDQGLLCKLQEVNVIKVESSDDHHHNQELTMINGGDDKDDDGDGDGFKTPTKTEHRLKVDLHCPPPAPMKPKSQLMKRRRPTRRPLFQVSPQEFELIFAPRSSPPPSASSSSSVLVKDDDFKKVNPSTNNNLTTIMSFR